MGAAVSGSLDSYLAGDHLDHLDDGKLEEPDTPARYRRVCNVCGRAVWVPAMYFTDDISITCDSCVVEGSDLTHQQLRRERMEDKK